MARVCIVLDVETPLTRAWLYDRRSDPYDDVFHVPDEVWEVFAEATIEQELAEGELLRAAGFAYDERDGWTYPEESQPE